MTTITFEAQITDEMIDDLMCAALEGGITYWCSEVKVDDFKGAVYASDVISRGGSLTLIHPDGESVLDQAALMDGIKRYCEDEGVLPIRMYDDHDAFVADHIVQLALFCEVIYG